MRGGAEWIRTLGSACLARKRPIFAIFLSPRRNPIEVSPVPVLILKKVERWLSVFVQRDDLAVDNRLIGQLIQCLSDCREAPTEVSAVARPQLNTTARLRANGAISIQLEFVFPIPGSSGSRSDRSGRRGRQLSFL